MAFFRRTLIFKIKPSTNHKTLGLRIFGFDVKNDVITKILGATTQSMQPPNHWWTTKARFSQSDEDDEVPELDGTTFHDFIRKNGKAFVMFYDPFCPVCRRSTSAFHNCYHEMKSLLAFGAVDATKNEDLAMSQDVNAFPTFRLYVCKSGGGGDCRYKKSFEGRLTESEMKAFVAFSTIPTTSSSKDTVGKNHGFDDKFESQWTNVNSFLKFSTSSCQTTVNSVVSYPKNDSCDDKFELQSKNVETTSCFCSRMKSFIKFTDQLIEAIVYFFFWYPKNDSLDHKLNLHASSTCHSWKIISFVQFSTISAMTNSLFDAMITSFGSNRKHNHFTLNTSIVKGSNLNEYHFGNKFALQSSRNVHGSSLLRSNNESSKIVKLGRAELKLNHRVMEVNSRNFETKIKSFNSALVYFYASWCCTCTKSFAEFLKTAEKVENNVGVLAICDAENNLRVVDDYGVGKIPTVKYFKKGVYVADYIGEIKVESLLKFLNEPPVNNEESSRLKMDVAVTSNRQKLFWEGNDGSELIIQVTDGNVDRILTENESLLLLFYTCWNKTCLDLKTDYINAAKAVEKPEVVLAACDCEENVVVADRFLVSKFPSLKYFRRGKTVREYVGDFRTDSILEFLNDPSKLRAAPSKNDDSSVKKDDVDVPEYWKNVEGASFIIHATDDNYKQILEKEPNILFMFYVPWCVSCVPLKKELAKAAVRLPREVGAFAACDAERNFEMADTFLIQRLPTLKYFRNGRHVTDYSGKRKAEDLIDFMTNSKNDERMTTPSVTSE